MFLYIFSSGKSILNSKSTSCRFSLLDKGSKLLYLNTNVRGYPFGMRAGTDPRKPIISVNGGFEKVNACSLKAVRAYE